MRLDATFRWGSIVDRLENSVQIFDAAGWRSSRTLLPRWPAQPRPHSRGGERAPTATVSLRSKRLVWR